MPRSRKVLIALSFLTAGMLGGVRADARGFMPDREDRVVDRVASFSELLLREAWEFFASLMEKNGASLDPWGQPQPSPPPGTTSSTPSSPEGPSLDPNG